MEELDPARSDSTVPSERAPIDRRRAAAAITEFLRALGFTPERDPDLQHTAQLVAAAYADELLIGYALDPAEILSKAVGGGGSDVVAVRNIQTTVMCPHHLMPASGVVHVAYAPSDRVVGLGALSRLVTCFARRLTLQETLVEQVANALVTHLGARGAACVADLRPTCLTARRDECHAADALAIATAGEMKPGGKLHATFVATLLSGRSTVEGEP